MLPKMPNSATQSIVHAINVHGLNAGARKQRLKQETAFRVSKHEHSCVKYLKDIWRGIFQYTSFQIKSGYFVPD